MKQFLDLCKKILDEGLKREIDWNRTISIFGHQMRFDLQKGYSFIDDQEGPFEIDYI
jgi:thymidylate synthase